MHTTTAENWYFTQVFGDDSKSYYTITFAKNTDEAKEFIHKWLDFHKVTGRRDIHLYLKNYKREARRAVANGQYIDRDTLTTPTHYIG